MNHKSISEHYKTIKSALETYRQTADFLAKDYQSRKDASARKYNEAKASGNYSNSYLQKLAEQKPEASDLMQKLEKARNEVKKITDAEIGEIRKTLASYFEKPVPTSFSSTVQALKMIGQNPSRTEIEFLKKSADCCYMAEKILQAWASTLTITEQRTAIDENGKPYLQTVETASPILFQIPDADKIYNQVAEIERITDGALQNYAGDNGQLTDLICGADADGITKGLKTASGNNFYLDATQSRIETELPELEAVADKVSKTESPILAKKGFTEADKNFIDSLVNPNYPSLARQTINDIANYGEPSLISLFLADNRYSAMMNDALTNKP